MRQLLPVYFINLDRRPDRLEVISARLHKLGIHAERVPAIDASSIEYSGSLTAGETACAMSHCKALCAFLDTGRPAAMVLEDGVELSPDTIALLHGTDWWPPRANLIKLDNPGEKPRVMGRSRGKTPTGRDLHEVMLSQAGAGAYLLTRRAADMVIAHCMNPTLPIDVALFDIRRSELARKLRPLQVAPAMANHDHAGSDIQAERLRAVPLRRRRLRTTAESLMQKARVFGLRAIGLARRYKVPFCSVDPEVLALSEFRPFTRDGKRHCYVHPDNPGLCVKVVARAEDQRCHARQQEDLEDVVALRRLGLESAFAHIPTIEGVVETDLGRGIVMQLHRDADGRISRNLEDLVRDMGLTPHLIEAIDELKGWMRATRLFTRDFCPRNCIAVHLGGEKWRVMISEGWLNRRHRWLAETHPYFLDRLIERELRKFDRCLAGR